MDEKTSKCKNNETDTFTLKISMKVVCIVVDDNNSCAVVNGGDILDLHIFSWDIKR